MSLPKIGIALVNPGKSSQGVAAAPGVPAFEFGSIGDLKGADVWVLSLSPEQMSTAQLFDDNKIKDENFFGLSIRALAFEVGVGGKTDDFAIRARAAEFLSFALNKAAALLSSVLGPKASTFWSEACGSHGAVPLHEVLRKFVRPAHWGPSDQDILGIVKGVAAGPRIQEGKQVRGNATFLLSVNRIALYESLVSGVVPAGDFERIDGGDFTYAPNRAAVLSLAVARAKDGTLPGFAHVVHRGIKTKQAHPYLKLWSKNSEYPLSYAEASTLHSGIKFEAIRLWRSKENVPVRAATAIRLPLFADHAKGMVYPGLVANLLTKSLTTFHRDAEGNVTYCDSMSAWLAGCARAFVMKNVMATSLIHAAKISQDAVKVSVKKDLLFSYRAGLRESELWSYPMGLMGEEVRESLQELEYQKDWGAV